MREMNKHKLPVQLIDAVDAKTSFIARELLHKFRQRPLSKRTRSSGHISDEVMQRYKLQLPVGAFAYLLSQRAVFEHAIANKFKKILVFDDDVFFKSDACEIISRVSRHLPEDIKILMLGSSEYAERNSKEFIDSKLVQCPELYRPLSGLTCGSFAVVYDRSIFHDVVDAIDEADGTFDNVVLGSIYSRHPEKCFSIDPAVCIPDVCDSDIRSEVRTQEVQSRKMNWEFTRFYEYTKEFNISILVNSFDSIRHIQSLKHELTSNVFLNIFYKSSDGIRPVITGHVFNARDIEPVKIEIESSKDIRALADSNRVPQADILILWPDFKEITEDSVLDVVIYALEEKNKNQLSDCGTYNDSLYHLSVGVKSSPGKHSIIIPSYRSVETILPTVKSALSQDAEDFEVIVVNDNPNNINFEHDLQEKLLQGEYEALRENLKIFTHKKNRGASAARNTGFIESSGEFITFLDDDDTFEKNRLSAVNKKLSTSNGFVGGCYCGYSGAWNGTRNLDRFPEGNLGDMVLQLRYGEHYMCTNTVSVLRASFVRLGGFNESYRRHQDLEFMVRFFNYYEIASVKEFLVFNRPNLARETFQANIENLLEIKFKFLSDMRHIIKAKGLDFIDTVVLIHANDIIKRDKNMSDAMKSIIKSFLLNAVKGG